jgi:hypothetical protein
MLVCACGNVWLMVKCHWAMVHAAKAVALHALALQADAGAEPVLLTRLRGLANCW